MTRSFLGVGWGFPVAAAPSGSLAVAAYEESVRQSIWIVLGTAKGERAMRPAFGCGIHDLVFERNTASTAAKVTQSVRDALLLFEPRIELQDVAVESRDSGRVMEISVEYKVRSTNNTFNLVFPFYLERGVTA
jgi:phage baseplate assembly protein W